MSGNVYYYLANALGSASITNATGGLCYDAAFYPFGGELALTNTCAQSYKFAAMEQDSEAGDFQTWFRQYSLTEVRWLSPDPLGGDVGDPQSFNRYDGQTVSGCTPSVSDSNPVYRRTGMCDTTGTEAWGYDSMGRVLADQRTTSSITKTTSYIYNLDGSVATLTYHSGRPTCGEPQGNIKRQTGSKTSYHDARTS